MNLKPEMTADELFRSLYECTDPDCTAPHVNMDDLRTDVMFVEKL